MERETKTQINILFQEKANLTKIIYALREEFTLLNSKLEGITKSVRMLNHGYEILDEILGMFPRCVCIFTLIQGVIPI